MIDTTGKKCTRKRGPGSTISSLHKSTGRSAPKKKASAADSPPRDTRRKISKQDGPGRRYFDLFNLAPIGYLVLNARGIILESNLTAADQLGIKQPSLKKQSSPKKRNLLQFIAPGDREVFQTHLRQVFSGVSRGKCDLTLIPKDRPGLIARLESDLIRDDDGAPLHCLTALVDITGQKKAEEQTGHLASFPTLNPNAVIEVDCSGNITYMNPATENILNSLGMTKEDASVFLPGDIAHILRNRKTLSLSPIYRKARIGDRFFGVQISFTPDLRSARIYSHDITGQRRVEKLLRRSEEKYRLLFENMAEGFALYELLYDNRGRAADWRVLEANEAYTRQTGVPREQVVGRRISDIFPDAQAEYLPRFAQVVASQTPGEFETYAKISGRFLRIIVFPAGENRFACTITDITASKQAEEALRKSNSFNQSIIDSSSDCIKTLDMDGRLQYMSPAGQRLLGIKDIKTFLNVRYEEFWKGSDREAVIKVIQNARQGQSGSFRGYCPTADGAPKWWDVGISPIFGAGGTPERLLAVSRDVTERQRMELALRESEGRFRALTENSPDFIALMDRELRHLYVNPAIAGAAGLPQQQFVGKTVREINLPSEAASNLDDLLRHVLKTGRQTIDELPLSVPGGTRFLSWKALPILDIDGATSAVMTIASDITDYKRTKQRLQKENREIKLANLILRVFVEVTGDDLYDKALNILLEGMQSRQGVFGYLDEKGVLICPSLSKMLDQCEIEGKCIQYPPGKWKGLWARALQEKRALYINEPRPVPPGHPFIHNNLAAPILFQGSVIGLFNLANKETGYSEDDKELLEGVAGRIAPVLFAWIQKELREIERAQAEAVLKQAHDELEQHVAQRIRFYNIRSQINNAAIRSRDVRKYLDEVCRVMIMTGGFRLAWVGIVDPQNHAVSVAASSGATDYLEGVGIVAPDVPEGRGPTGLAIREGRHIINLDFETNEMMRPWRERARKHSLRSSSAFPLRAHGEIVGAVTIYSDQPFFFTGPELSLLLDIADDISFAIESFDTEQKRLRAEQELLKTAAELQDLYNNAPCGYHSLDKDGVIVRINDTELSWLGYSREEVVGKKKITDFYTPESVLTFKNGYPEFMLSGTADREIDIVHRDGSVIHVALSSTAVYNADGKYVMSRSMLYDVTDRKKAEKQSMVTNALLSLYARKFDRKEYLSAAVELIRDWSGCRYLGIRVVDDQKNIPYLSCIGFSEEFLASERTLSLERDHCACTRAVLGAPEPQDLQTMTAAGSFYSNNTLRFVEGLTEEQKSRFRGVCVQSGFLSVAVVPIRYSDSILGALHVADEREGMVPAADVEFLEQLALIIGEAVCRFDVEEERMRLASALESTADGVVVTHSRNGRIEYVNRAFEQITGYTKAEAVGNDLHLLDSGRHNQAFFEELRSTLRRDGVWRGQVINKKKDGSHYFEDCTFSPVHDRTGHILNYVSIKRDVTEKLRMESIAESVSMMDNIGAVFAGVRHEIGNPVNNVKMILSVLRRKLNDLAPERVRYYTDRMYDEIGRLEQLLRTLKTFNLFENPVVESLDAASLLGLFHGLVREDLEARGIALSVRIMPGAERIRADARALQQVLLNLTTNAADALKDRDHPLIAITLSREDSRVHIRICDNGAGMTKQQQKNLFKPFQTTKPSGTGLGLVIVKKMLASVNGSIAIESTAGKGTIVHVHLPAEDHIQLDPDLNAMKDRAVADI